MKDTLKIKTGKIQIQAKRRFGQNFLIDENIAKKIVDSVVINSDDVIVEIGPGQGALTKYLIQKTNKIYAIEIDRSIIEILQKTFSSKDIIFYNNDFLEFDLSKVYNNEKKKIKLIGNIPYNITSQILFKAIDNRNCIEECTFMIQKEVAERIVAKPRTKSYGILSIFTQFYCEPKILFKVSANCFFPKPKVTSVVLKLKFFEKLKYDIDENLFRLIIRAVFGKRRKILLNSLKYLNFYDSIAHKINEFKKFSLRCRAEDLSIEEFVELTNFIHNVVTISSES